MKRDSLYNLLGNGIPIIIAIFTIPYLLGTLGDERFGVLTLQWSLVGYFGIFDLGVGRAMTYEVSRAGKSSRDALLRLIRSGFVLTLLTGVAGMFIVGLGVLVFWLLRIRLDVSNDYLTSFAIISLAIIPTTTSSSLRGVLEGFGNFRDTNIFRAALGAMMFLFPVASIALGFQAMTSIAYSLVFARLLVCSYLLILLHDVVFTSTTLNTADICAIVGYGGWVTVSSILSPLMVYGDRFIVSMFLGAGLLPFYTIPQEGLSRLLLYPTAIASALMPRFSSMTDVGKMKSIYYRYFRQVGLSMGVVCFLAALFAYPILAYWLNEAFAKQAITVCIVLSCGVWLNSLAQLPATLLHSLGKPRITALLHLFETLIYTFMIIIGVNAFGILGAAIAWTVRVMIDFIALQTITIYYFSNISTQD